MASNSKRQMTMAKMAREQAVREKRARKQQKKDERRAAAALGGEAPVDGDEAVGEAEAGEEPPAAPDDTAA